VAHDATDSPLWQIVNEYFPKLVDYVDRHDQHVPAFVERELEAFLACGQIERGFTHIRCATCDARQLVPFTCKSRALCPLCFVTAYPADIRRESPTVVKELHRRLLYS